MFIFSYFSNHLN